MLAELLGALVAVVAILGEGVQHDLVEQRRHLGRGRVARQQLDRAEALAVVRRNEVEAAVATARELGGSIVTGPIDAEGVGRFTTSSVVFMIIAVLVLDAMFPPLFLN